MNDGQGNGGTSDLPHPPVPIDLRRRDDALIQVARLAAELFWRNGFAATRGEDIAAAAGISPRTLWRYFRSKEACVEPVLHALADQFISVLEGWPDELSIHEFLSRSPVSGAVRFTPDQVHAMRVVQLGRAEPALRHVWLAVCDEGERRCVPIFARRMGLPVDAPEVLRITAAVCGANRAYNDSLTTDFIERGLTPIAEDVIDVLVWTVAEVSGGRLGGPIDG
ncbi:TetR/AcrR family transcriptional regulator [Planobispora siamensis]|uniref:TetR family transcriptional regulator n=1 Tax=Planobispora siamensis TaxID=936338 RepID=A0A8J3SRF2_9ACTN|nr:TetR/AcrR family transcriptional regulator [Planobispora siamensis]GIH97476.1 TetR family transcriptional regulator [Planobispora siamensis]